MRVIRPAVQEFRAMSDEREYRCGFNAVNAQGDKLPGRRIDPMCIFDDEQHWLSTGHSKQPSRQCVEQPSHEFVRR